jgi:hypothetical protein
VKGAGQTTAVTITFSKSTAMESFNLCVLHTVYMGKEFASEEAKHVGAANNYRESGVRNM